MILAGSIGSSGAYSLTKINSGTLTLGGTNTYSGGLDLEAGIVVASNAAAWGTGTATIGTASTAGTLRMGGAYTIANAIALSPAQTSTIDLNGNNTTFSGVISGGGATLALTNSGGVARIATLTGVNTHSGITSIGALTTAALSGSGTLGSSTVSFAAPTSILDISAITLTGNATIDSGSYTGYLSNPITGAFALTVQGSGAVVITGANTPGSTTIAAGTLALDMVASLANGITINNGATYDLSRGAANPSLDNITANAGSNIGLGNQTATITSGTITGNLLDGGLGGQTGAIVEKTGGGTATLSGANTYSGGTNLHGGVLTINGSQSLGVGPVDFVAAGATLRIGSSLGGAILNNIVLTADGILDTQVYNVTLGGTISGVATLRKLGSGILTLAGANIYNGAILQDGIIALGNNQGFGGGTFSFNTAGTVLRIATPLSNVANPVALVADGTIDTAGNDANFTGSFSGVGGLTKNGLGALRLANPNNSYSGPTVVNGGELKVPNGSLLNSPVTVENGAHFTGNATVLSLINRGTTKPGNSIGIIQVLTDFDNTGVLITVRLMMQANQTLIRVTNTATLRGTLHVMPQAGDYTTSKTSIQF